MEQILKKIKLKVVSKIYKDWLWYKKKRRGKKEGVNPQLKFSPCISKFKFNSKIKIKQRDGE